MSIIVAYSKNFIKFIVVILVKNINFRKLSNFKFARVIIKNFSKVN